MRSVSNHMFRELIQERGCFWSHSDILYVRHSSSHARVSPAGALSVIEAHAQGGDERALHEVFSVSYAIDANLRKPL